MKNQPNSQLEFEIQQTKFHAKILQRQSKKPITRAQVLNYIAVRVGCYSWSHLQHEAKNGKNKEEMLSRLSVFNLCHGSTYMNNLIHGFRCWVQLGKPTGKDLFSMSRNSALIDGEFEQMIQVFHSVVLGLCFKPLGSHVQTASSKHFFYHYTQPDISDEEKADYREFIEQVWVFNYLLDDLMHEELEEESSRMDALAEEWFEEKYLESTEYIRLEEEYIRAEEEKYINEMTERLAELETEKLALSDDEMSEQWEEEKSRRLELIHDALNSEAAPPKIDDLFEEALTNVESNFSTSRRGRIVVVWVDSINPVRWAEVRAV